MPLNAIKTGDQLWIESSRPALMWKRGSLNCSPGTHSWNRLSTLPRR